MYRKVLNYLRGQVTVEVESAAPERVLNLCAAHGIPFWELEWLSEIRLRAVTSRAALPRLQAALAQTDAAVTVLRRQGAPEVWRQYRRRYVLWAAAGLLLAASVLGSTHIWAFQVTGNDTVPTETILRTLEKYGVTLGSRQPHRPGGPAEPRADGPAGRGVADGEHTRLHRPRASGGAAAATAPLHRWGKDQRGGGTGRGW